MISLPSLIESVSLLKQEKEKEKEIEVISKEQEKEVISKEQEKMNRSNFKRRLYSCR